MNRNDKNKKFTPLNINNVFKGKTTETQNKTSFRVAGMQNIGKVSCNRRVPAPKWVPSIKAETGGSESRQIINQALSGWVGTVSQEENDQNTVQTQSVLNKDKNQWISKATSNKPFFLMGQEFPSLSTDGGQDINIDSSKPKDAESVKSKLDELRSRDNSISVSTLNRIDALSISKSSKGDIAATGWAAEDEEPNFDEKIIFSDEESLNEEQNWHSDPEIIVSKADTTRIVQSETHEPQISISDTWYEQSQPSHYAQYPQFQMQMNMSPNQFMASNPQFQQAILNRQSVTNINDDHSAYVAEQRNARNMEYYIAIERARLKKMGSNRPMYAGLGDDALQAEHLLLSRSRHTSMTSDTTESNNTPIEMGPPGGPPLMYGHMHRPHISPMIHPTMMSPPPITVPPLIQFTQPPPFMMPIQAVPLEQIADPKLMEKWVEFLRQQQQQQQQQLSGNSDGSYELQQPVIEQSSRDQAPSRVNDDRRGSSVVKTTCESRTTSQSVDSSVNRFVTRGTNDQSDSSAATNRPNSSTTLDNKTVQEESSQGREAPSAADKSRDETPATRSTTADNCWNNRKTVDVRQPYSRAVDRRKMEEVTELVSSHVQGENRTRTTYSARRNDDLGGSGTQSVESSVKYDRRDSDDVNNSRTTKVAVPQDQRSSQYDSVQVTKQPYNRSVDRRYTGEIGGSGERVNDVSDSRRRIDESGGDAKRSVQGDERPSYDRGRTTESWRTDNVAAKTDSRYSTGTGFSGSKATVVHSGRRNEDIDGGSGVQISDYSRRQYNHRSSDTRRPDDGSSGQQYSSNRRPDESSKYSRTSTATTEHRGTAKVDDRHHYDARIGGSSSSSGARTTMDYKSTARTQPMDYRGDGDDGHYPRKTTVTRTKESLDNRVKDDYHDDVGDGGVSGPRLATIKADNWRTGPPPPPTTKKNQGGRGPSQSEVSPGQCHQDTGTASDRGPPPSSLQSQSSLDHASAKAITTTSTTTSGRMDDKSDIARDGPHNNKSMYSTEDGSKSDSTRRINRNKYNNYKEYHRSGKPSYKGEYSTTGADQDYGQEYSNQYGDDSAYDDYRGYHQQPQQYHHHHHQPHHHHHHGYNADYHGSYDYPKTRAGQASYQYYDDSSYAADSNDYSYKTNSLKYRSTRHKDYLKPAGSQTDCTQSEKSNNFQKKQSTAVIDVQEKDIYDSTESKSYTDGQQRKTNSNSYANKRYDSRPYKDRPSENKQEFSMGFAVNPNDSRRNNYYSSNYSRRGHNSEYGYQSYQASQYHNDGYYQDKRYYDDRHGQHQYPSGGKYQTERTVAQSSDQQYDQDTQYQQTSSTKTIKKPIKTDQWRSKDSRPKLPDNGPVKSTGRGNRKNDKRQSSMSRDANHDNDPEEWETASEGVSDRINAGKQSARYQPDREGPTDDSTNLNQDTDNNANENSEHKYGLTNTCNSTWPSYPDEDEYDGASGPSGGFTNPTSNMAQSKATESTQNQNSDNNGNNSNPSKSNSNISTSDNSVRKESIESRNRPYTDFIDIINSSSVINVDKLPEVTEDEELLYENVEQFQEVLSKATKKNRRLEELRKLKEELEQKKAEELKLKVINERKASRRPVNRKEQHEQKSEKVHGFRKVDNTTSILNSRDKYVQNNNNVSTKYESNNVSMSIGSWDNSLADVINPESKIPPNPIGTPASTSSWNVKLRSLPKSNGTTMVNLVVSQSATEAVNENSISQIAVKNSQSSKNIYSPYDVDAKYNSIFDRVDENKKIKEHMEPQTIDMTISESLTFDYNAENVTCENDELVLERALQKNNQQLLNEKINSVKTIWDNQPHVVDNNKSDNTRASVPSATSTIENMNIDHSHITTSTSDSELSGNIDGDLVTSTLSITNVCKVKPQLQNDLIKKEVQNNSLVSSATYLVHNQGNMVPYPNTFQSEYISDHLQPADCLRPLLSANQPPPIMHINYNLPNQHNLPADHILANKMNFINNQQSFYPQAAVTPKIFSNVGPQLPMNMELGSSQHQQHHGSTLPLQQLLLTRQNSLTTMMQANGMSLPFIPAGQQHAHNTPMYQTNPILGPASFSPQMHTFSPGHYSPGNFQALHQNHQFQQNQILLNHHHQQQQQQQQHHHQQQMLQNQISHDRVINSGQSGIFNSIMGPSDISTNAGLPDFNGQSKNLNHNNIMHGINGSAIMLPHNLNYLMKPHHFASNSQYNNFTVPIQSNHVNVRNSYENHSNIKLASELATESYRQSKNFANDRQTYFPDNIFDLSKQKEELYIEPQNYENSNVHSDNWSSNIRQTISNNFQQSFDFQSQRPSVQFPFLDLSVPYNESEYRTSMNSSRDNNHSLNVHNSSVSQQSHHEKQHFRQIHKSANSIQKTCNNYDNVTCVENDYICDNNKKHLDDKKPSCDSTVISEQNDTSICEKSCGKKGALQQRYADNLDSINSQCNASCEDHQVNVCMDSHSGHKQYTSSRQNIFNNQYGYNDTQLSSQTAASLGKFDSEQLKKMIMKLREGPVMTITDFDSLDVGSCGGGKRSATTGSTNRPGQRFQQCDVRDNESCVGMGFYSTNCPLTGQLAHQSVEYKATSDIFPLMNKDAIDCDKQHCSPPIDSQVVVDNDLIIINQQCQ